MGQSTIAHQGEVSMGQRTITHHVALGISRKGSAPFMNALQLMTRFMSSGDDAAVTIGGPAMRETWSSTPSRNAPPPTIIPTESRYSESTQPAEDRSVHTSRDQDPHHEHASDPDQKDVEQVH